MKISINSNQSSLMTLRYLDRTNADLRKSFERLSSGLRINRAVDDAAGLAISERGRAESRVLGQATRNISDGVSLFNIADGASQQIGNLLTRMAELAEQAANGSITSVQRRALNDEYMELDKETRRISETTEFNGIKIFAGEASDDLGTTVASSFASSTVALDVQANGKTALSTRTTGVFITNLETRENTVIVAATTLASIGNMSQSGDAVVSNAGMVGSRDIFHYDAETKTTTQLTDSGNANDIGALAYSHDGSTVFFTSRSSYADGQEISDGRTGVSGTTDLYRLDMNTNVVNMVYSDFNASELAVSADGRYLAARVDADFGGNGDGNEELFVADVSADSAEFYQITDTSGSDGTSDISGVGTDGSVTYASRHDLDGSNPGGVSQVFYSSLDGTTRNLTQLGSGSGMTLDSSTVDLDRVHFSSIADLTGDNPGGNRQMFSVNVADGTIEQLSRFDGSNGIASYAVSKDGGTVTIADNSGSPSLLLEVSLAGQLRNFEIESGYGETAKNVVVGLSSMGDALRGLGGRVLTSQDSARDTLDALKENIQELSSLRGTIGAGLSRLSSAFNVTKTQQLELQRAVSQIRDVDVATESATLARNTTLQQAQASVLAQANQQPSLALRLLSGL